MASFWAVSKYRLNAAATRSTSSGSGSEVARIPLPCIPKGLRRAHCNTEPLVLVCQHPFTAVSLTDVFGRPVDWGAGAGSTPVVRVTSIVAVGEQVGMADPRHRLHSGRMKRMPLRVVAFDHVQLAMPVGREPDAEAFYRDVRGFAVLQKPEPLASLEAGGLLRGMFMYIWVSKTISAQLARRIRRSLLTTSTTSWRNSTPSAATWQWNDELPGARRLYVDDPFGNRIELIDGGV